MVTILLIFLSKQRGRPIKVEKNKLAPDSKSANGRYTHLYLIFMTMPDWHNLPRTMLFRGLDLNTKQSLNLKISASNKEIVLLTRTFASPSTKI